jgi:predicted phage terminase large subunit-like protein
MQLQQSDYSPAQRFKLLPQDEQAKFLATLSEEETLALQYEWEGFWARPKQISPSERWQDGTGQWHTNQWAFWLLLAGRGFGKTASIVQWAIKKARALPGSRGLFIGATASDVRDILIEGASGIMALCPPDFRPLYEPSKRKLTFPNDTTVNLRSADEPERLRGPQFHWGIADEIASWRYAQQAWDMIMFGLRLGDAPQMAIATTPKPTALVKALMKDPNVAVTKGTTYENRANLAKTFFEQIITKYENTRLGRQELLAELLTDTPGALWRYEIIDPYRVSKLPELIRIVVSIDPAISANETSNETGIVVAGVDRKRHYYILDDLSLRASPNEWASVAVSAFAKWEADAIVAETNQGGDMVESVIKSASREAGIKVGVKKVHATRGKLTRAEPISLLYEQGVVHHYGAFPTMEDQLTTWVHGEDSPDRLDAMVWALTELDNPKGNNKPTIVQQSGLYNRK